MGNSSSAQTPLRGNRAKCWDDGDLTKPCCECNKTLNRYAIPYDDDYWHAGHNCSEDEGGSNDKTNLNPTCTKCNNGKYKTLYARDRVNLKLYINDKLGLPRPRRLPAACNFEYYPKPSRQYEEELKLLYREIDNTPIHRLTPLQFY
jgi:hypothetical protein